MRFTQLLPIALLATLVPGGTVKADVIFTNLGPGDTFNTFIGAIISGDSHGELQASAASSFLTGPSAWHLETLELGLRFNGGENSFVVNIMEDSSGLPAGVLRTISLTGIPSSSSLVTVNLNAPLLLEADRTYWIALAGVSNAGAQWYLGQLGGSLGAGKLGGGSWTDKPPPSLKVSGTIVPEPGSLTILGTAGMALFASRAARRKHRNARDIRA